MRNPEPNPPVDIQEDVPRPVAPNLENAIIHAEHLSKRFKDFYAVRDVSFYVPDGAIFGFIGPSGSGKTTTIRLLTGVYLPSEGSVTVLGKRPDRFDNVDREKIGYLPQNFVLYPNLTVWENLNFTASLYGVGFLGRRNLGKLLDLVELSNDRNKLASQLSGGMQRRLSLASTLIHNPHLIFLDEPTAGIDPILRSKFWDHFNEMKKQGQTLFITTQYVGEAAYCDLVGIMSESKLIAVDTPDGLRKRALGGSQVSLRSTGWISHDKQLKLEALPSVVRQVRRTSDNQLLITVDDASTAIPQLIEWAGQNDLEVESIEESKPNFDDVFVKIIEASREANRNG
jgi:ABC-2 type transport system ATP-binding protein